MARADVVGYGLKLSLDGKWVVYEVSGDAKVRSPVRERIVTQSKVRFDKRKRGNPARLVDVRVHYREPVDVVEDVGQSIDSAMVLLKRLLGEQVRAERLAARKASKEAA